MKKYMFECWNVAFRKHSNNPKTDRTPFTLIKNPVLFWAADPFIIHHGEKYYVFAELYNRLTFKGEIRYCIINEELKIETGWKKALYTGSHLSFPYIYLYENDIYMMPESSKAEELSIYKAEKFPDKWVLNERLVHGEKYADSVFLAANQILTYDNYSRPRRVVLLKRIGERWHTSLIYDDPQIVFRPGGKPFDFEGKMIVPLQDSHTGEYGRSLNFCSIVFSEDEMITHSVFELATDDISIDNSKHLSIKGIHTFNFDDDIEVVDVKTYSHNFFSLIGYALKKLLNMKRALFSHQQ